MPNVFDTLKERGFVAQCTNEQELHDLFDKERVTFYIGFDPTADSLHAGHFIALMAMAHLQRAGHRPICLVGGGTGTVGDPTGRTDMRKMLTDEQIEHNCECFKKQMARFIDFSDGKAIMANNADWLRKLNYVDMLRDVGACFTVNRMLAAECYKQRWEKGLTFLEFNYMVMQAYDFLELNRRYGCKLQMGGDDQWSNIIAGVELNRRKSGTAVYGLTNKLLTKSDGKKMGKTAGGALWLDAEKTSPYEFYQYWRNVDDADVEKCLALLTFLPMEEVHRLGSLEGSAINEAKTVLAYEVTKIVHGEEEAKKAKAGAEQVFGGGWKFTFDGLFSKTLNNVFFKNLALQQKGVVYGVDAANAPSYEILMGVGNSMFIALPIAGALYGAYAVFIVSLSCMLYFEAFSCSSL